MIIVNSDYIGDNNDGIIQQRIGTTTEWNDAISKGIYPAKGEIIVEIATEQDPQDRSKTIQVYKSRLGIGKEVTKVEDLPLMATESKGGVGQTTIDNGEIFNYYEDNGDLFKNEAFGQGSHAEGISTIAGAKGIQVNQYSEDKNLLVLMMSDEEYEKLKTYADTVPNTSNDRYIQINNIIIQGKYKLLFYGFQIDLKQLSKQGLEIIIPIFSSVDDELKNILKLMNTPFQSNYIIIQDKKIIPNIQTITEAAHAEGYKTKAQRSFSHAEGYLTNANGEVAHAEGLSVNANGINSHAEGAYTLTEGENSHAEGHMAEARGYASHSEGENSIAEGNYSHAENENTQAIGDGSHVEGYMTKAYGKYSHAEGYQTKVGKAIMQDDNGNLVYDGDYSHASGEGTIARGTAQTVIGKYNMEEPIDAGKVFVIGNGSSDTERSNAFTVDFNGNTEISGDLVVNGDFTLKGDGNLITSNNFKGEKLLSEILELENNQIGDRYVISKNDVEEYENANANIDITNNENQIWFQPAGLQAGGSEPSVDIFKSSLPIFIYYLNDQEKESECKKLLKENNNIKIMLQNLDTEEQCVFKASPNANIGSNISYIKEKIDPNTLKTIGLEVYCNPQQTETFSLGYTYTNLLDFFYYYKSVNNINYIYSYSYDAETQSSKFIAHLDSLSNDTLETIKQLDSNIPYFNILIASNPIAWMNPIPENSGWEIIKIPFNTLKPINNTEHNYEFVINNFDIRTYNEKPFIEIMDDSSILDNTQRRWEYIPKSLINMNIKLFSQNIGELKYKGLKKGDQALWFNEKWNFMSSPYSNIGIPDKYSTSLLLNDIDTNQINSEYSIVGGTENIDDSTSGYNLIGGYKNKNLGTENLIWGHDNEITSTNSLIVGYDNINTEIAGDCNFINGNDNIMAGYNSVIIGSQNIVHPNLSFCSLIGNNLEAAHSNQYIFGKYNERTDDSVFVIGNGTSSTNKSNLLTITNQSFKFRNLKLTSVDSETNIYDVVTLSGRTANDWLVANLNFSANTGTFNQLKVGKYNVLTEQDVIASSSAEAKTFSLKKDQFNWIGNFTDENGNINKITSQNILNNGIKILCSGTYEITFTKSIDSGSPNQPQFNIQPYINGKPKGESITNPNYAGSSGYNKKMIIECQSGDILNFKISFVNSFTQTDPDDRVTIEQINISCYLNVPKITQIIQLL